MSLETVKKSPGRIWRLAAGWGLTIGGLILGPVPILPGFVLLLPGLALLCAESRWLRALLRRHREKRLLRHAMRAAQQAGITIDLDSDAEGGGPRPPDATQGRGGATGSGG